MPPKKVKIPTAKSVGMAAITATSSCGGGSGTRPASKERPLKRPAASSPLKGQSSSKKLRDITNTTPGIHAALATAAAEDVVMEDNTASFFSDCCKEGRKQQTDDDQLRRSESVKSVDSAAADVAATTYAMCRSSSSSSVKDKSLGTVSTRAPTTAASKACISSEASSTIGRDWEATHPADLLCDVASPDEDISRDSWASDVLGNIASGDSWPGSSVRTLSTHDTPTSLTTSFPIAGNLGSSSRISSTDDMAPSESRQDRALVTAPLHRSFCDADSDDAALFDTEDPQCVGEYLENCWEKLAADDTPICPPGVQPKTPGLGGSQDRSIIVDWLAQVQTRYRMRTETLFLAVNINDRFLTLKKVAQREVKLVGVTSVFIASKFEEIYPPEVKDFVFLTEQACTREAILQMEGRILVALEFRIALPTPMHFVERIARANRCSEVHRHLINYVVELTLMDARLNRYAPSHLAAAAVLVSNRLLKSRPGWPALTATHAGKSEQNIRRCAREIMAVIQTAETSPLQAMRRKYMKPEFLSVASMTF